MANEKTLQLGAEATVSSLADTDRIFAYDSGGSLRPVTFSQLKQLVRDSIQVGGRNLIKDSASSISNTEYLIKIFSFGEDAPKDGEQCVMTIWGERENPDGRFRIFLNGDLKFVGNVMKIADGVYRWSGKWAAPDGGESKELWLFKESSLSSTRSTIYRVKLERGNIATDWSPAPEDWGGVKYLLSINYEKGGQQHEREGNDFDRRAVEIAHARSFYKHGARRRSRYLSYNRNLQGLSEHEKHSGRTISIWNSDCFPRDNRRQDVCGSIILPGLCRINTLKSMLGRFTPPMEGDSFNRTIARRKEVVAA
ncbi:MAG: hypothetical protein NC212_08490 [Staphylococcus sp.]|nr:hypothetical protein [Staphylococcus sp.]